MQSQFLLIHGWSNPHQIEDMDQFDSPPIVDENKRMTVDLTKAMSKLNRKNYIEGGIHKITNLKIETEEEE